MKSITCKTSTDIVTSSKLDRNDAAVPKQINLNRVEV